MRDVLVIGGGVIGLSAALELLRAGLSVCVLEAGRCGEGASSAAAGMLCPGAELKNEKKSGDAPQSEQGMAENLFHFARHSLGLWAAYAQELEEETGLRISYQASGSLILATDEKKSALLKLQAERLAGLGCQSKWVAGNELKDAEPGLSAQVQAALFLAEEGHVNPRQLSAALVSAVQKAGGEVIEQAQLRTLEKKNRRIMSVTLSDGRKLEAEAYVLSAGLACRDFWAEASAPPFYAIKGQACRVAMADEKKIPQHILRGPEVYLCPKQEGRIFIGATEEPYVETLTTQDKTITSLLDQAKSVYPLLAGQKPFDQWAGLRPTTPDLAPVIGRSHEVDNLIYAAGHHRNGILLTPATAQLVRSLVLKQENDWACFTPGRFLPAH